ncbi:MAG: ABC transporter substrate-binding protein, partial [Acidobacteriaceae bacterium]
GPGSPAPGVGCACGAHPPGAQPDRTVAPYAGTPEDLKPFGKFATPYYAHYTHPNVYSGAARDVPDPKEVSEVRIGFLGPVEKQEDQVFGLRMLHGAQLAVEEANARGGYGGKPFRLMVHDDYNNWQRGAEYGERPTDAAIWGSPSDEAVKMIYEDGDWAIFGSISSESTHIILRVALRAEIPIVNSASTDPTIPETYIPWYFTDLQDDRVQSYTLARRIFTELRLKRAALLRVNNRYGRLGVVKFRDAARRLGHPVVIEQKFMPGDTDYRRALRIIRDSRADAIVLWADEAEAAGILKQMRELGMKERVFGSYRTLDDELLADAGPAAEGFEAVYPYDPTRSDAQWAGFEQRYTAQYREKPEAFASLAYDAMNVLLASICRAGLNRARIQDALDQVYRYVGVTGPMVFDPLNKNVSPMYLGTVHAGKITYRVATMSASDQRSAVSDQLKPVPPSPYARVGEDGVGYAGPQRADIAGAARIVIFGARAAEAAASEDVRAAIAEQRWSVAAVDSGQNWGAATTQLVEALGDGHTLAVVALDRDAAHFAEQLALK